MDETRKRGCSGRDLLTGLFFRLFGLLPFAFHWRDFIRSFVFSLFPIFSGLRRIVVDVESRSFEHEIGGRNQLFGRRHTLRTDGFTVLIDPVDEFEDIVAAAALVFVDRRLPYLPSSPWFEGQGSSLFSVSSGLRFRSASPVLARA